MRILKYDEYMVRVDEKVKKYFSSFPKREYPNGQILIFGNEDPEHIFYMQEGKVRQYDVSYRGDEVIVSVFKAGASSTTIFVTSGTKNRGNCADSTDGLSSNIRKTKKNIQCRQ